MVDSASTAWTPQALRERRWPAPCCSADRAMRLWIICRVFVTFLLLWIGRRFARVTDARRSRAIEECACAVAPLVLFALVWLLTDPIATSRRKMTCVSTHTLCA